MESYHPFDFRLFRMLVHFYLNSMRCAEFKPCFECDQAVCEYAHLLIAMCSCLLFVFIIVCIFILDWGKEIAFPFGWIFFHLLILFLFKFASLPSHPNLSLACLVFCTCINNCISIKISNLFSSSKSEKNFVRHFDFCMTQKIKIYNQIPYIFDDCSYHHTLLLATPPSFIVFSFLPLVLVGIFILHFACKYYIDKWRHIPFEPCTDWEYDRKMAKIFRFRITFSSCFQCWIKFQWRRWKNCASQTFELHEKHKRAKKSRRME